jgi:acetyl esterase/lipase
MTTTLSTQHEIEITDVEYIRHEDGPLLLRLYRPSGVGPFPLIVDVHGGAWCSKDRTDDAVIDEALARSGVVVAALDFRMPPRAQYPASLADINYAIRWLKVRAHELSSRRDWFGILGVSSGGHQAMLAAMRPNDARYAALPGDASVDATLRCAVLCWPVIDPLARYRYAKKRLESGDQQWQRAADRVACHDLYWPSEAAMDEGNPALAIERGEPVQMPPVLYLQGTLDKSHPRENLERFVAKYCKAGGKLDFHWFEGVGHAFISKDPKGAAALDAVSKIIEFVHRELH